MTIDLYGIPNCDTVKKARTWLAEHGVDYRFHDFKKAGVDRAALDAWIAALGWETLVNRKGTTWRGMPEDRRAAVIDAPAAATLMLESPSIIKRPVLCAGGAIHAGFSPDLYQRIFDKTA